MQLLSAFFFEENDFLYRKGALKAREGAQHEFVTSLIIELNLPDEKIATIAKVPVDFVKEIREQLKK